MHLAIEEEIKEENKKEGKQFVSNKMISNFTKNSVPQLSATQQK